MNKIDKGIPQPIWLVTLSKFSWLKLDAVTESERLAGSWDGGSQVCTG